MSDVAPLLDRRAIEDAFRHLGDRLVRRGVVADIYIFGGAAMALAYDAGRATRDIDAVFKPHGIVLEETRLVADELGLPGWWLNEQASAYVATDGDPTAPRVFDHPGLRVAAASAEHLLAMKILAARRRDGEDIQHSEPTSQEPPHTCRSGGACLVDWAAGTREGATWVIRWSSRARRWRR